MATNIHDKDQIAQPLAHAGTRPAGNQADLSLGRRSFLRGGVAAAGTLAIGATLLSSQHTALAKGPHGITRGDADILRFLAAAEIIETDLWQQYNELAGIQDAEVPGGSGNPDFTAAVQVLDEDMDQYIHDNTDDEMSHELFLNAFLVAHGRQPVNLDRFRTLPSSRATGAQQIGASRTSCGSRWTPVGGPATATRTTSGPRSKFAFRPAVRACSLGGFQHSPIECGPPPAPTSRPSPTRRGSLRDHRGGRYQPLPIAGPESHTATSSGSFSASAQRRRCTSRRGTTRRETRRR